MRAFYDCMTAAAGLSGFHFVLVFFVFCSSKVQIVSADCLVHDPFVL